MEMDSSNYINSLLRGFSDDELTRAFNIVAQPDDWKGHILAFVDPDELAITVFAIEFFTATIPVVSAFGPCFLIRSEGYRAGPAGDH
jgi:hypothetical protein